MSSTKQPRYLPTKILEVCVPHIEGLGGEGIGLDINVCSGYLVDETRFSDVWETFV